ncbi:hypothetical protein TNCV_230211 [Trichonephila clavipes]|nr:hypothetical protein TNCV_230211 [Trichonephila clavipes]
MNEAIMAPHRRRKPAPVEYITDEEDMIQYDVEEDEFEPHPDLAEKDGNNIGKEIYFQLQLETENKFFFDNSFLI